MRRLKPSLIASPAVQQVLTKEDVDWVGGSFDSPISIWIGEPVVDLAEHKVWEDEGCSSHPPSVGDLSDGTLSSLLLYIPYWTLAVIPLRSPLTYRVTTRVQLEIRSWHS